MANTTFTIRPSSNGNQYSQYPNGDFNATPSAPGSFAASATGSDVDLTWTDTNSNSAQYQIERSANAIDWTTITTTNAGATSYQDLNVPAGLWYYRARARSLANQLYSGYTSPPVSVSIQGGTWQLPSGYFMTANQAMMRIYPRPDGETSTNARHRWAYYDGSNNIPYRVPVGVAFGAPPFHFELLSGPSGMTIGADRWDTDYGVINWVPAGSVTGATVSVRVTDQQLNQITITWTVSTSSSTSHFMFVSNSGSDANSGAIGSPKQTLVGVFGSTYAASSNVGAKVYLRAGTYSLPAWTDTELGSTPTMRLNSSTKPVALMAYPGESVTIPATNSMISMSGSGHDSFISDILFTGYRAAQSNYQLIFLGPGQRTMCWNIDWTSPGQGTTGNDNATMFFGSAQGSSFIPYLYLKSCTENGRPSGGGNNYGFCSLYSRQYVLIENCQFAGYAAASFYIKGTNYDVCVRGCDSNAYSGYTMSCGFSPVTDSNRIEFCYNKIKTANDSIFYPHEGGSVSNLWFVRNSLYSTRIEFAFPNSGSYLIKDNAIVTNASPIIESGSQVTVQGTECQGTLSAGIMDSTSLNLTGAYRTNWLGRRGYEISGGA